MNTRHFLLCTAAAAAFSLHAAPVLPGYLTDPSAVKSAMGRDSSYNPPEQLQFPYVSTYYVTPRVKPGESVAVGFFVTDFESSKIRFLDDSHRFDAFLELRPKGTAEWKRLMLKDLPSGDHAFQLGALAAGDWEMRLWAVDKKGRESHRVMHDFRVADTPAPSAAETYVMSEADLAAYGIRNDGDLATIIWEGSNETKTVRTKNPNRPGYTVHVPTKDGKPVFRSWQTATIDYDAGYDAAAVEAEAVKTAEGLQKLLNDKAQSGVKLFKLLPGTYRVSAARKIEMPDNLTLDLNGATIKENAFTGASAVIVKFASAKNATLMNGTLEGDYYEHDYKNSPNNSEWPLGFEIGGASEYCTVRNVKVTDITGYGGSNGISKDSRGGLNYCYENLGKFAPGGLDPKTGEVDAKDAARFTTDFCSLAKVKDQGRIQISKYLGYQGRATRSWQMTVCWYDATKKFLASETSWQYREMFIPADAAFLRVSIEEESQETANKCGLRMTRFRIPINCAVENCTFERCRCVGYAASAMKNMLFKENFFTASGENAAKCAFDAEDGWDQMQDVYFLGNTFRDNPINNSILTCCGHNFILEKNDCDIHFWGRTHSPVVRDNTVEHAGFTCDTRLRSGYGRFVNNRFLKKVTLGNCDMGRRNDTWDFVIAGLEYDGAAGDKAPEFETGLGGRLVNCTFKNMKAKIGNAYACRFENCTGDFYPSGRWTETTVKDCKFRYFYGTNVLTRCHVSDSSFTRFSNGRFAVIGGEFTNCQFLTLDRCDFGFKDVRFDNTFFKCGYWEKPGKAVFRNCHITPPAKTPFVSIALYTIGDWRFFGCTVDGDAALYHVGDQRPQPTDDQPGYVRIRDCTWKSSAPYAVTRGDDKKPSPKKLHLEESGMTWPAGTAMVADTLPPAWTHEKK